MGAIFSKLNIADRKQVVVLGAPDSFRPEMASLQGVEVLEDAAVVTDVSFALVFAMTKAQVDAAAAEIGPKIKGDGILWFAYPKGSSKKYKCDFNRDTGWDGLQKQGFDSVRMVAIDEDWSALRFRRVEHISRR
jgi:hypothetical protein